MEGKNMHQDLMAYETKFLQGTPFTNKDVEKMQDLSTRIVELMKANNKRAAAMRPWFRVDE